MDKKKVLIVTQEMQPYTALSEISEIARQLPQYIQENGMEIRILMPRYGTINERRHRLHEVVRLSGMNIIVEDDDYPLILKVASLPGARMQVYFLDNEEFFKRKSVFEDADGKPFEDNADRMVFFCKGIIETVKKFGWAPDIIHCHGWMTSLVPMYLKTAYKTEPIFQNSRVIYSAYEQSLGNTFEKNFLEKAAINNLEDKDLEPFFDGKNVTLQNGAITYADGIIKGSAALTKEIEASLESLDKPILNFPEDGVEYLPLYMEFYQSMLELEVS